MANHSGLGPTRWTAAFMSRWAHIFT